MLHKDSSLTLKNANEFSLPSQVSYASIYGSKFSLEVHKHCLIRECCTDKKQKISKQKQITELIVKQLCLLLSDGKWLLNRGSSNNMHTLHASNSHVAH
jgi:hypothetical protein